MPLTISVERPQPVELRVRFGAYATIAARDGDGRLREAPALLAAVRPVPGWERACLAAVDAALPPCGATIAVQGTAVGLGAFDELAVVDVLVADDRTLAEQLVANGLAVPDPDLLDRHLHQEALIAAVAEARRAHAGCWAEAAPDPLRLGLSPELAARTAPPAAIAPWIAHGAWLFLAAVVLLLAWREAYWRGVAAAAPRHRLRRLGELLVGWSAGLGRPLPPVERGGAEPRR